MASIADDYSIIYSKHTGKECYHSGMYSADFVNAICKQHKEMKAQLEEMQGAPVSSRQFVDAELVKVNMATMLGELKLELTGEKKATVNL